MLNYRRNLVTLGITAVVTCNLLIASLRAQGPSVYHYPPSQSSHTWRGKGGSLVFSGRALHRAGDYVLFKTTKGFEITLPVKYLGQQDQQYLSYLAGEGPAPSAASTDTRPAPAGMTPVDEPDDRVPPDDFFGPSNEPEMASDDEETSASIPDPALAERTFKQGQSVEVKQDDSWHQGNIAAVRPSNNTYFVQYKVAGIPKSRWVPATDLRPVGGTGPDPVDPFNLPSTTGGSTSAETKEVTIKSQSPVGYMVGPLKQGDKLKLSYISGKWKAWGRLATESPDAVNIGGGDKCRLAICEFRNETEVVTLTLVPAETSTRPFTWTAKQDYDHILLQINDNDNDFASNPASDVKYSLTIEKAD